jgi:hypothetical protein
MDLAPRARAVSLNVLPQTSLAEAAAAVTDPGAVDFDPFAEVQV